MMKKTVAIMMLVFLLVSVASSGLADIAADKAKLEEYAKYLTGTWIEQAYFFSDGWVPDEGRSSIYTIDEADVFMSIDGKVYINAVNWKEKNDKSIKIVGEVFLSTSDDVIVLLQSDVQGTRQIRLVRYNN